MGVMSIMGVQYIVKLEKETFEATAGQTDFPLLYVPFDGIRMFYINGDLRPESVYSYDSVTNSVTYNPVATGIDAGAVDALDYHLKAGDKIVIFYNRSAQ